MRQGSLPGGPNAFAAASGAPWPGLPGLPKASVHHARSQRAASLAMWAAPSPKTRHLRDSSLLGPEDPASKNTHTPFRVGAGKDAGHEFRVSFQGGGSVDRLHKLVPAVSEGLCHFLGSPAYSLRIHPPIVGDKDLTRGPLPATLLPSMKTDPRR